MKTIMENLIYIEILEKNYKKNSELN